MKAFATLYSRLDATTSSNAKLAAMRDYFRDADPADVLEHVTLLHVLWIAAEAIKNVMVVQTTNVRNLCKSLSNGWLVEM